MAHTVEPPLEQILRYCAENPVERVFLEDVARRGLGRFAGLEQDGRLVALCHTGRTSFVRAGLRRVRRRDRARQGADADRRAGGGERPLGRCPAKLPAPREDRPGQPVYTISAAPPPGESGLRPARLTDLDLLVPASHERLARENAELNGLALATGVILTQLLQAMTLRELNPQAAATRIVTNAQKAIEGFKPERPGRSMR